MARVAIFLPDSSLPKISLQPLQLRKHQKQRREEKEEEEGDQFCPGPVSGIILPLLGDAGAAPSFEFGAHARFLVCAAVVVVVAGGFRENRKRVERPFAMEKQW